MADSPDTFSLAKALRETGFSSSIITTFNAYLPFYEEVVLRRLIAAGCTQNVVLMDARQCAASLAHESTWPRRAGIDYTLIPVLDPGAFHPKILLRLGKKQGSLFVGSHNLTVAGFGLNHELTNRFRYDTKDRKTEGTAFADVAGLLRHFASTSSPELVSVLDSTLDAAPWIGKSHAAMDEAHVIGSQKNAASLWDQIRQHLPAAVRRVLVISPFFDDRFDFIRRVHSDLGSPEIIVGIDPDTAYANAEKVGDLSGIRFVDLRGQLPSAGRREGVTSYLHAKALVFETDGSSFLVTGSANATSAALLAIGRHYNTECVVIRKLDDESGILEQLGLNALVHAPEISIETWRELSSRLSKRVQEKTAEESHAATVIAVATIEGFRIDSADGSGMSQVFVQDLEGTTIGHAYVSEPGPPMVLRADAEIVYSSGFLVWEDGATTHRAIVHRPAKIAQHYSSDLRRALRQTIGSLDEHPDCFDELLKLSMKVIFEDPTSREKTEAQLHRASSQTTQDRTHAASPDSLALEATGRRAPQKRRKIASGDITVLLDAFIHLLGTGEVQSSTATYSAAYEEERIRADDQAEDRPSERPELQRTGAACRRKTQTLLKRMTRQLESTREDGAPHWVIIQLAAVLGILRALGATQRQEKWRKARESLLHMKALQDFYRTAIPLLTVGNAAIIPAALKELQGEPFEELSMTYGLLIWLAWECQVDLAIAQGQDGQVGVDEDQWPRLQCLTYLAPFCATDIQVWDYVAQSINMTPRRDQDGNAWLNAHRSFILDCAAMVADPAACSKVQHPPRPGDFVYLAPKFHPRIRIVVRVQAGSPAPKVLVMDEETDNGERAFRADLVERLEPPNRPYLVPESPGPLP